MVLRALGSGFACIYSCAAMGDSHAYGWGGVRRHALYFESGARRDARGMDRARNARSWRLWRIYSLGIRIGEDAVKRLGATGRELSVTYYDSATSPCACLRTASRFRPEPRWVSAICRSHLKKLRPIHWPWLWSVVKVTGSRRATRSGFGPAAPWLINRDQPEPRQRWEAVMRDDTLFVVQDGP